MSIDAKSSSEYKNKNAVDEKDTTAAPHTSIAEVQKDTAMPPDSMSQSLDGCSHEENYVAIPPMPKTIAEEIVKAVSLPLPPIPEETPKAISKKNVIKMKRSYPSSGVHRET